jgi:pimeloyl-ACP methyl ester carboxylesterase
MAYTNVWRQDWTALFLKLKCPLLLMCAEDDVLYPFFQRARELRPDAQIAPVRGANFEPDLDPGGVASAVWSFLDQHGF